MVQQFNIQPLGTGSRTTTGILVPSQVGGTGYIDTSGTDWLAFHLTITGSGTVQVETSFDGGTTWATIYAIRGSDGTTQATATSSGLWFGNSVGGLTRLNVTAVTGTVALVGGTTDVTNAPNGTPSVVVNTPATASAFNLTSAATTNATLVKSSAGNLYEIDCSNTSASPVFLKLYNKASAPTVGTDTPLVTLVVPANAHLVQSFASLGKRFTTGIAYAITGLQVTTDTTAIAAGVLISGVYL